MLLIFYTFMHFENLKYNNIYVIHIIRTIPSEYQVID